MTRTRRPSLAGALALLLVAAGMTAAPASAAPPTPADGMCALLTPADIATVFPKGEWQVADDGETASECFLHNGLFDKAAASVIVKLVPSTADGADGFFADLHTDNAGAVDLDVARVPAVFAALSEGGSLYVRGGDDWWFTVETTASPAGLDGKLRSLGAIVAGRLGVAGASASPSPSSSPVAVDQTPAGSELCELLTLGEVAAAVGEPLVVSIDERDSCVLAADAAAGSGASVTLTYRLGDLNTMGTLEDQAREQFPAAPRGMVLGVPALYPAIETTETGLARASIELLPDPQTWISVAVDAPTEVDVAAGVLTLAGSVVTRTGTATGETVVPGTTPGGSPAPSGDLASLFPTEVDGSPVTLQAVQPLKLMNLPAKLERKLAKALKAQSVTLDDASFAVGTPASQSVAIIAFQVRGADIRAMATTLVEAIGGKRLKATPSPTIVGAREAFLVQDSGGTTGYAHPAGDTLWLVFGKQDDAVASAFAVLP